MTATLNSTGVLYGDSTQQNTAFIGRRGQIFTAGGTFTVPAGITAVKITVVGGGGGANSANPYACSGGGGGVAIKYLTGLTPAGTLTITVGALGATSSAGGTSSVASGTSNTITTVSAAGGAAGLATGAPAAGGVATNGDINLRGVSGVNAANTSGGQQYYLTMGYAPGQSSPGTFTSQQSGCCIITTGVAGTGFGAASFKVNGSVVAGTAGAVIFEW